MKRKFRRDQLRKEVGNRNMKNVWAKIQKKKYGIKAYCEMTKKCDGTRSSKNRMYA